MPSSRRAYFWDSFDVVMPPEGPFAIVSSIFEGVTVKCQVRVTMPWSLSSIVRTTSTSPCEEPKFGMNVPLRGSVMNVSPPLSQPENETLMPGVVQALSSE